MEGGGFVSLDRLLKSCMDGWMSNKGVMVNSVIETPFNLF